MNEPELKRLNKGERISAVHYDTLVDSRNKLRNLRGDGRLIGVVHGQEGTTIKWLGGIPGGIPAMPAKITGDATDAGFYNWTQQIWSADAGAWVDGGNSETTMGPAYEVGGATTVAADTIVMLHRIANDGGGSILAFQVGSASSEVWVKITSASAIGGQTNRWTYSGPRMIRTATGWAAYSPSTTISGIYNSREADNDGTGVQGNGIDITGTDFPAGFSLKSLATGTPIVRVYREVLADETVVWTCDAANAVDGTCT